MSVEGLTPVRIVFKTEPQTSVSYWMTKDEQKRLAACFNESAGRTSIESFEAVTDADEVPCLLMLRFSDVLYIG
jgi:hypothetical protein